MKDAVYTASSVPEALRVAGSALGVPTEQLRYVVLEAGGEDQPARIAVLLDAMRASPRPVPAEREAPPPPAPREARVRRWFEVLGEALDAPVDVEVDDRGPEGLQIRVVGTPPELETDEWGALERLLQRAFGPPRAEGRVTVEVPGLRESREARLRDRALELARDVREDGEPRRTEPLNSYERRLVHIAVGELGGLATESEGEGPDRCVVIRRADAPAG